MKITPTELKKRLNQKAALRLIDVREPDEWEKARLPGAELIPLSIFQHEALEKLSPGEEIVLYCHHGIRSARAQEFLKARGYENVINLTGGIEAWSAEVDSTVPRY